MTCALKPTANQPSAGPDRVMVASPPDTLDEMSPGMAPLNLVSAPHALRATHQLDILPLRGVSWSTEQKLQAALARQ